MVSMTVFLILITIVTAIFINLYKIKWWLEARQRVTQETYFLLEKLQTLTKNYTIDYEEYWNRKNVWCTYPRVSTWNTGDNCSLMTYYGNRHLTKNLTNLNRQNHKLFYCSSQVSELNDTYIVGNGSVDPKVDINQYIARCIDNVINPAESVLTLSWFLQSYGQYAALFTDVKDDVDYVVWSAGDDDDLDIGNNVDAIAVSATWTVQELYLISHDKQRRIFIRRHLQEKSDINGDGIFSPSEKLYTLQILQLKWFDAGESHNFSTSSLGVYDGHIDTWACDYSAGFECSGNSISWAFSNYRLPSNNNDGWKDLLWTDITVTKREIEINPLKDPLLAWDNPTSQQNPYIKLSLATQLYAKNRKQKLTLEQMNTYILPIQTMFSFVN